MSTPHVVCRASELPPGARKIIEVAGRSIGVFNVAGKYYALRNSCPHQQAPLCLGTLTGAVPPSAPGEYRYDCDRTILRCPWHGWEFDVATGQSVFNPHQVRVKKYEVTVQPPAPDSTSVPTYSVTVHDDHIVVHV